MRRRGFLGTVALGATAGLAGCSKSDSRQNATSPTGTTDGSPPGSVGLETLATGLQAPLGVAFATEADRRYVVTQPGRVFVHEPGGLRDEPFLDLRDTVETGSEKGLLGMALHPEFGENRRLFVRYSAPRRDGTPPDYSHTFVLAEFEATADGLRARRDSERTVLEIPEPQSNHNAGSVAFGPDGHLYVGVGDGGSGGDQGAGHADDWYDPVNGGNGQDVTENLLGSVLRIDVDDRADGRGYAVPDDNPLVGGQGRDEHYAWGFRNPWRFSFDDGTLYVGDVGQNSFEEVSLVENGGNYGWNVKEGTHCFRRDDCPDATPQDVRGGEPLVDPVIEYPHSGDGVSGVSVIGGYVYRGSTLSALQGTYVFGDLQADGRLFVAQRPDDGTADAADGGTAEAADDGGLWPTQVLPVSDEDASKLQRILAFGRDEAGELYVLGTGASGGGVHRVVPAG